MLLFVKMSTSESTSDVPKSSSLPVTSAISNSSIVIPPDEHDDPLGPRQILRLQGDQILVKLSHVNDVLSDLKMEVFDEEEEEGCHFVRILRIGPEIKNKDATVPGALVICHKRGGSYLERLSEAYGETYFLLHETDIMTYTEM